MRLVLLKQTHFHKPDSAGDLRLSAFSENDLFSYVWCCFCLIILSFPIGIVLQGNWLFRLIGLSRNGCIDVLLSCCLPLREECVIILLMCANNPCRSDRDFAELYSLTFTILSLLYVANCSMDMINSQ